MTKEGLVNYMAGENMDGSASWDKSKLLLGKHYTFYLRVTFLCVKHFYKLVCPSVNIDSGV